MKPPGRDRFARLDSLGAGYTEADLTERIAALLRGEAPAPTVQADASATYTATASYTGTASSKYATGYTVTARYTGELERTISGAMVYTAVFTGAPTAPMVQELPTETPAGAMLHYGLPALIIAALLVVAGVGVYQLIKHRRNRRYPA